VSLTIGGALVNRVSEQFRYKAPVVIFVCKEDVNIESLISCIQDNAYPELEVMLLMSATKPYNYYHLYVCTSNAFSKWIEDNLTLHQRR
ncbi:MAG: hypothetical protein IJ894_17315, partial [Bacteroidales bacterium]|nr:hypothetical protein [Bacteroidales bacterium]